MKRRSFWMLLPMLCLFAACGSEGKDEALGEMEQVREQMNATYAKNTSMQNAMMTAHEAFEALTEAQNDPALDSMLIQHTEMLVRHEDILARHAEFMAEHENKLEVEDDDGDMQSELATMRQQHQQMEKDRQVMQQDHEKMKADHKRFMPEMEDGEMEAKVETGT